MEKEVKGERYDPNHIQAKTQERWEGMHQHAGSDCLGLKGT